MTLTATPLQRLPRALALVLGLLMVAGACTDSADEPFNSVATASEDGGDDGGGETPPPDPDCDPADATPSRRPEQPLPEPGNMPAGTYMAEIQESGQLRAGVAQDTLLFGFLNPENGEIEGFDVEIAKLVTAAIFGEDQADARTTLVPIQSAERIPGLVEGRFDVVAKTMTITCQRWGSIDFSSVYFESGQTVLVRQGEEADINKMSGERLCAAAGTTSIEAFDAFDVEQVAVPGWTDCLVLFQQGQVDGISTDDTILAGLAAQDPIAYVPPESEAPLFSDEPYGIGSPKDHPEFTQFINAVLEEARTDGTWQRLYDEWVATILGERQPPAASYR